MRHRQWRLEPRDHEAPGGKGAFEILSSGEVDALTARLNKELAAERNLDASSHRLALRVLALERERVVLE